MMGMVEMEEVEVEVVVVVAVVDRFHAYGCIDLSTFQIPTQLVEELWTIMAKSLLSKFRERPIRLLMTRTQMILDSIHGSILTSITPCFKRRRTLASRLSTIGTRGSKPSLLIRCWV